MCNTNGLITNAIALSDANKEFCNACCDNSNENVSIQDRNIIITENGITIFKFPIGINASISTYNVYNIDVCPDDPPVEVFNNMNCNYVFISVVYKGSSVEDGIYFKTNNINDLDIESDTQWLPIFNFASLSATKIYPIKKLLLKTKHLLHSKVKVLCINLA